MDIHYLCCICIVKSDVWNQYAFSRGGLALVAQPGSIKKVAAAAFFKLRSSGFDKEECKDCLKSLSDDLESVCILIGVNPYSTWSG